MNFLPRASVIIDNYNYGRFLAAAIDSALAQTYSNVEVIVVDDGSTDSSRDVIFSYGNRIKPILKGNGGQGSAFNAGLAASEGDVIFFLDSDDIYLPEAVERAMSLFSDSSVVKVQWPLWLVDEHGAHLGQMYPGPNLPEGDFRDSVREIGPTNYLSAPGGGCAWVRSFLNFIFPIPETIYRNGCDTFMFEAAAFFGKIRTISDPLSCYRQHGKNDHRSMDCTRRVEREIERYDHYSEFLSRYCASQGYAVDVEVWKRNSWWHRQQQAFRDIATFQNTGGPIIIVDDCSWEGGEICGRQRLTFIERNGQYWGPPTDDDMAIREIERMRAAGAEHIVFPWQSFWWLEYYTQFEYYLRSKFRCVLENEQQVAFELKSVSQHILGAASPCWAEQSQ